MSLESNNKDEKLKLKDCATHLEKVLRNEIERFNVKEKKKEMKNLIKIWDLD